MMSVYDVAAVDRLNSLQTRGRHPSNGLANSDKNLSTDPEHRAKASPQPDQKAKTPCGDADRKPKKLSPKPTSASRESKSDVIKESLARHQASLSRRDSMGAEPNDDLPFAVSSGAQVGPRPERYYNGPNSPAYRYRSQLNNSQFSHFSERREPYIRRDGGRTVTSTRMQSSTLDQGGSRGYDTLPSRRARAEQGERPFDYYDSSRDRLHQQNRRMEETIRESQESLQKSYSDLVHHESRDSLLKRRISPGHYESSSARNSRHGSPVGWRDGLYDSNDSQASPYNFRHNKSRSAYTSRNVSPTRSGYPGPQYGYSNAGPSPYNRWQGPPSPNQMPAHCGSCSCHGTPRGSRAGSPNSSYRNTPRSSRAGSPTNYSRRSSRAGSPSSYSRITPRSSRAGSPSSYSRITPRSSRAGSPSSSNWRQHSVRSTPRSSRAGSPTNRHQHGGDVEAQHRSSRQDRGQLRQTHRAVTPGHSLKTKPGDGDDADGLDEVDEARDAVDGLPDGGGRRHHKKHRQHREGSHNEVHQDARGVSPAESRSSYSSAGSLRRRKHKNSGSDRSADEGNLVLARSDRYPVVTVAGGDENKPVVMIVRETIQILNVPNSAGVTSSTSSSNLEDIIRSLSSKNVPSVTELSQPPSEVTSDSEEEPLSPPTSINGTKRKSDYPRRRKVKGSSNRVKQDDDTDAAEARQLAVSSSQSDDSPDHSPSHQSEDGRPANPELSESGRTSGSEGESFLQTVVRNSLTKADLEKVDRESMERFFKSLRNTKTDPIVVDADDLDDSARAESVLSGASSGSARSRENPRPVGDGEKRPDPQSMIRRQSVIIEGLTLETDELKKKIFNLEDELLKVPVVEDIQTKLATVESKLEETESFCYQVVEENVSLKTEIETLESEISEVQDTFREKDAKEFKRVKWELESLAKTCRNLQLKLSKAQAKANRLRYEKEEMEEKKSRTNYLRGTIFVAAVLVAGLHMVSGRK